MKKFKTEDLNDSDSHQNSDYNSGFKSLEK